MKSRQIFYDVYACVMFLLFPLFILPSGYRNITMTKYIFFAAATLLFAAVKVCFLIKDRAKFRLSPSDIFVLLYLVFCAISALASPWGAAALKGLGRNEGLLTLLLYGLCFFILSGQKFKPYYVLYLAASGLVFSLISLVQIFDKNPFGLYPGRYHYYAAADVYTASFLGTIGNVGMAAVFLSVCIPLFFSFYVSSDKKYAKILPFISAFMFFILLWSDVDAGKVAVVLSIVIMTVVFAAKDTFKRICRFIALHLAAAALCALILPVYEYPTLSLAISFSKKFWLLSACSAVVSALSFLKLRRIKLYIIIFLAAAVIFALLFVYFYGGESGMLYEARELMHGRARDTFGSNRLLIWKECLKLTRERPLLGGGPDTLAGRLTIVFERTSDVSGALIRRSVDTAHNEYLNVLVNCGILALIPFLGLCVSSLFSKDNVSKSAYLGYIIGAFFSFSVCITAPFFWIFAAFLSHKNE